MWANNQILCNRIIRDHNLYITLILDIKINHHCTLRFYNGVFLILIRVKIQRVSLITFSWDLCSNRETYGAVTFLSTVGQLSFWWWSSSLMESNSRHYCCQYFINSTYFFEFTLVSFGFLIIVWTPLNHIKQI